MLFSLRKPGSLGLLDGSMLAQLLPDELDQLFRTTLAADTADDKSTPAPDFPTLDSLFDPAAFSFADLSDAGATGPEIRQTATGLNSGLNFTASGEVDASSPPVAVEGPSATVAADSFHFANGDVPSQVVLDEISDPFDSSALVSFIYVRGGTGVFDPAVTPSPSPTGDTPDPALPPTIIFDEAIRPFSSDFFV